MDPQPMRWVHGTIVQGHRVASGLNGDPRFPLGTIRPQLDAFRTAIPDMETYLGGTPHAGTINIAVAGNGQVTPGSPEFHIGPVKWTDHFAAEFFLITRATLQHAGQSHPWPSSTFRIQLPSPVIINRHVSSNSWPPSCPS